MVAPTDALLPASGPVPPCCAVVVVNFGSHALLERNLGALDLAALGARAVVVDNFRSTADSRAIADLCAARGWQLLARPRNEGFGVAVNAGVAAALRQGCDVLAVLNPDLTISSEVLAELAAAVRADPKAVVSPLILQPDGTPWFRGAAISLDAGRTLWSPQRLDHRSPPWLSGACLTVHRDTWTAVGGFDDEYFLYWEDVDLSYRLVRLGARLQVREDLTAVHDEGGTQRAGPARAKSPLYYYYNCRNRLLFAAKHLGRRDRWRWLVRTPADVRRVLLRGGRRQLVHPRRCVWPAVRGAAAGAWWLVRPHRTADRA